MVKIRLSGHNNNIPCQKSCLKSCNFGNKCLCKAEIHLSIVNIQISLNTKCNSKHIMHSLVHSNNTPKDNFVNIRTNLLHQQNKGNQGCINHKIANSSIENSFPSNQSRFLDIKISYFHTEKHRIHSINNSLSNNLDMQVNYHWSRNICSNKKSNFEIQ